MSDDASAILRSNHVPASLKRRRAEDSYSGGSTGRSGCLYGGCGRLGGLENGTDRRFCSKAHMDYFMGELYDRVKNGAHLTQEPSGICKLPKCDKEVWVVDSATGEKYDFCRLGHAVEYRKTIIEQWGSDDRLCKFDNCSHHVHVDESTNKIGEYCSRDHLFAALGASVKRAAAERKELAAAKGVSLNAQDPRSDEVPVTDIDENQEKSISQETKSSMQPKIDNHRGYHDKVPGPYMVNCLTHLLKNPGDFENADLKGLLCPQSIGVSHPFDEVTEFGGFKPKWYLHYIDSTGKLKSRSTKQGFKWKQSSRPNTHKTKTKSDYDGVKTTYYHYELTETGCKDDQCEESVVATYRAYNAGNLSRRAKKRWRMSQFSLTDDRLKKVIGVELAGEEIPIISKIWQERNGLRVWPPVQQETEKSAPLGSTPEATRHAEEIVMTSVASNATPPGDPTFQGGNPNEVIANESNAPVIGKPFSEETAPVEDTEMIGTIVSNASRTGQEETLSRWETPKNVFGFNELEQSEFDEFLMDLSAISTERNAPVTGEPFSRFQEDRGMTSSSSSNASLSHDLPNRNSDHVLDLFDQPQVGGEYILSAYLDGTSW